MRRRRKIIVTPTPPETLIEQSTESENSTEIENPILDEITD